MKNHKFEFYYSSMKRICSLLPILLFFIVLVESCDSRNRVVNEEGKLLPFSVGQISSIYLYSDPYFKNSDLKDSLAYYFNQPYLLTPSPSPVVDLVRYDFNRLSSGNTPTANNLILVNIAEDSQVSNYLKKQIGQESINKALENKQMALLRVTDVNAKPQQFFYLISNGPVALNDATFREQLQDYVQNVIERSTALDNQRILSGIDRRRTQAIEEDIQEQFGISIWIPREYKVVIDEDRFLWLIRETDDLYSNITFYKTTAQPNVSLEDQVIPLREEFGKYITTYRDSSRMTTHTDSKPYPIQRHIKLGDVDAVETRGLWRMVNDRLGGGFVNYTFENKAGELIAVDGFVYYNDDDKRRQMRDIDAILSTITVD